VKPWYKVTFDPTMLGTARAFVSGRKRKTLVQGRWIVFDKNCGYGTDKLPVFDAATMEECCAHIDELEANRDGQSY
jgi:hypothetical protein